MTDSVTVKIIFFAVTGTKDKSLITDSAHSAAAIAAANSWYQPGTAQFDSVYNAIINIPTRKDCSYPANTRGSKFVDASSFQHIETQYDFTDMLNNKLNLGLHNVIAGASFRRYNANSYGTIFSDTLVNPADEIPGAIDINAEYVDINTYEYGAYTQVSKRLFDKRLKLTGSIRFDDHVNYNPQFSPRVSAVYTYKDHNFRIAAQSAFRAPTLQNQYLNIDLGDLFLVGNLNGSTNNYITSSVDAFLAMYDLTDTNGNYIGEIKPELLKTITLEPVQPEHLKSIEVGYRSIINNKLYIDLNAYYNSYNDFIANIRVIRPKGAAVAGEESGSDAILTGAYREYQIPVNVKEEVITYSSSIGLHYYFGRGLMAKLNYTYAFMDTSGLGDIIPGFNTPRNKYNIGLVGTKVYKGFGFSINYKKVDGYFWESSFADGNVPAYDLVDVQVSYDFSELHSILRIGASNLLENKHIEAYGAPTVGRIIYTSWTFNL